jgi:hypothetical protein
MLSGTLKPNQKLLMFKRLLLIAVFIVPASFARSQVTPVDTIPRSDVDSVAFDSSIDYDELFNDLDLFLDSLLKPRSYALVNLSAGQGYFNFANKNNDQTRVEKKIIWSPTFGYYDKSGFGITLSSYMIRDSSKRYWYQLSVSPSYDYIKNRDLVTGISYTRYFTKNLVPFYTSPLQSELNGYFLWRKSWLQPGITANYGWGSRTEYNKRDSIYREMAVTTAANGTIRHVRERIITILSKNKESIVDFSMTASLRHDFYWLDIFSKKDHIRFSPLISLAAGTQKFGFNQTNRLVGGIRANTQSLTLQQKFQLLSTTLYLRGEYSFGKFFIQPQFLFDYYFPGEKDNLTTVFSINTGFMF